MYPKQPSTWQQQQQRILARQRQENETAWRQNGNRYDDIGLWRRLGAWLAKHPQLEDLPPELAPLLGTSPEAQAVRSCWVQWNVLPVVAVPAHRWILRTDWQACLDRLEQRLSTEVSPIDTCADDES